METKSAYQRFLELHQADLPQTGFDYQFYYFLFCLFNSDSMDRVVYEGEDDIEWIRGDKTYLIQVKHSAISENLTDLDEDLWHTIKNWIEQWKTYGDTVDKYNLFAQNHLFQLVTNKPLQCRFVNIHDRYLCHEETELTVRQYLNGLKSDVKKVQDGIDLLRLLSDDDLRSFLLQFRVVYIPNVLERLHNLIAKFYYSETKSSEVLYQIIGKLHEEKYNKALKRYKLDITRYDFNKEYGTILNGENPDLPRFLLEYNPSVPVPNDYRDWMLFKQLSLIDEVDLSDENDVRIMQNYAFYFHYDRNIRMFIQSQLTDQIFVNKIEDEAYQLWDREFKKMERLLRLSDSIPSEKELVRYGSQFFSDVMLMKLREFDFNFSNGCFLKLSNENNPRIGWHRDWKKLYTK